MVEKSETINFNIRVPRALADNIDQVIGANHYKNRTDCVIEGLRHVVRTSGITEQPQALVVRSVD